MSLGHSMLVLELRFHFDQALWLHRAHLFSEYLLIVLTWRHTDFIWANQVRTAGLVGNGQRAHAIDRMPPPGTLRLTMYRHWGGDVNMWDTWTASLPPLAMVRWRWASLAGQGSASHCGCPGKWVHRPLSLTREAPSLLCLLDGRYSVSHQWLSGHLTC